MIVSCFLRQSPDVTYKPMSVSSKIEVVVLRLIIHNIFMSGLFMPHEVRV